jgi:hypothetical protein
MDPRGAHLQRHPQGVVGADPSPEAVTGLENRDLTARSPQSLTGPQPGEARPDHQHGAQVRHVQQTLRRPLP